MSAREVINRQSGIARTSITDIVDISDDGSVSINKEKLLLNGHSVKNITINRNKNPETGHVTEKIKIELYPADDALKWLGKHHSLYTDRLDVNGESKHWIVPVDPSKVDTMDPLEWVQTFKPLAKRNEEDNQ